MQACIKEGIQGHGAAQAGQPSQPVSFLAGVKASMSSNRRKAQMPVLCVISATGSDPSLPAKPAAKSRAKGNRQAMKSVTLRVATMWVEGFFMAARLIVLVILGLTHWIAPPLRWNRRISSLKPAPG